MLRSPVRRPEIDNIKGLLIVLTVLAHTMELVPPQPQLMHFYNFIYIFHMPAFLFLSGYLSRGGTEFNATKVVTQLFIPFLFFNGVYEIAWFLQTGAASKYLINFAPCWILWFVFSLMCMRLLSPVMMVFKGSLALAVVIGVISSLFVYNGFVLSLSRTLVFLPYYIAGCLVWRYTAGELPLKLPRFAFPTAVLFLGFCFYIAPGLNIVALYGNAPLAGTGMPTDEIITLRLGYYILSSLAVISICIVAARFNWLRRLGENALYIYLWHGLLLKFVISHDLSWLSNSVPLLLIELLAMAVIITLLFSRQVVARFTRALFDKLQQMLLEKHPSENAG